MTEKLYLLNATKLAHIIVTQLAKPQINLRRKFRRFHYYLRILHAT